jgi:hypothetical protein
MLAHRGASPCLDTRKRVTSSRPSSLISHSPQFHQCTTTINQRLRLGIHTTRASNKQQQSEPERSKPDRNTSSTDEDPNGERKPRVFAIQRLYQRFVEALGRLFSPLLSGLSEERRKWIITSLRFAAISVLVTALGRHALSQRSRATPVEVRPRAAPVAPRTL